MVSWPRGAEDDPDDGELSVACGVDDNDLLVVSRFDSHMGPVPQPRPYVALVGKPQGGGPSTQLVVAVEQVPALVAALTRVSYRTAVAWEREGEAYWAPWQGELRGAELGSGPGRPPLPKQG